MGRAREALQNPVFFGVKPEMVLMHGSIVCAKWAPPNASTPTPQPEFTRPMFAAMRRVAEHFAIGFVFAAARDAGIGGRMGLAKQPVTVANTRGIGKKDRQRNNATPDIKVNPNPKKCAPMASLRPAHQPMNCPWYSGIFCFNIMPCTNHRRCRIAAYATRVCTGTYCGSAAKPACIGAWEETNCGPQ